MNGVPETPLLETMASPFALKIESSAETPLLESRIAFPLPAFTRARRNKSGRQLPQAIAHRGYKAAHPENTMGAFAGAVKAGAHAIETDVHLSKDGVVVLSHDATLKRCFGRKEKIIDCDWECLSRVRTVRAPHEPMPRLKDLLQYLAAPGLEHIWLLLDIKLDNNAEDIVRLIAQTIRQVSSPRRPWSERIVLGCWAGKFLPLCDQYLPNFSITHIGFSIAYARQFLDIPSVSFNMLQRILMGPLGQRFLHDAQAADRPIYAWTVNEVEMMRWCIDKGIDGVITDDPKSFLDVCHDWQEGRRRTGLKVRQWLLIYWVNFIVVFFSLMFMWRYGFRVQKGWKKRAVQPT